MKIIFVYNGADIEECYTGFAHDIVSLSNEKVRLYCKYEILFQLRSFVHNDKLFAVISKAVVFFPLKKLMTKIILFMNALKNRDFKAIYLLKYIWSKKNTL